MGPNLDAIGIVTSDVARCAEFFRLLGVDFPEPGEEDHIEATLANGLRLMLDDQEMIRSFMPEWKTPIGQRLGLAFLCSSPADVDATVEKVRAAGFGVEKEPWDAFWGQRYAMVANHDGMTVDLFAPLA